MTERRREDGGLSLPAADEAVRWLGHLPAAAAILAPDGRVLSWNEEAAALLGCRPGGTPHLGTTASPWLIRLRNAVESQGRGRVVISRHRRGGARVVMELRGRAYDGRNLLVLLRDCTSQLAGRRKRSEDEQRLRQFLERLPEPVLIEQGGRIAYANEAASRLIGLSAAVLQGQRLVRYVSDNVEQHITTLLRSDSPADEGMIDVTIRRADGTTAVAQLSALPLHYRREPAVQLLLRDVTAYRQAEAGLRATHERLRLISEVVRDHAIMMIDNSGEVVSWNVGAERLTGYSADDVIHFHVAVLLTASPDEVAELLSRAEVDGRVELETDVRRSDRSTFPAHVTITGLSDTGEQLAGFAVIIRDLSERLAAEESLRRSEEQLRHSQKMDAIGRLAAGIAHDFNNVLTAIQGHVQFLLEDLPTELAARDDAAEIKKAADRATELTRQLLTFARKQPSRPVPTNPNELITGIEKLLRRLIRADVTLDTVLEDAPNVLIDPGQLEQVLVNLVVNARDAISNAGAITVSTSRISLDAIYSARGLNLLPGTYVQISVSDTGTGMSMETQRQVFEPFFTTKAEGTGLGLSTVYGIVKQAGGHVSVYSEPGSGTTFKVFLPIYGGATESESVSSPVQQAGTVLLVEDDDAVRGLARRTLEGKGYAVVEAADGEEALRLVRDRIDIDVVVTDLTMPKLNGEELAQRIRETQPDAGIVLMSGFPETALVREGRIHEHGYFLEKPFTPTALVDVVEAAMHHEGVQSSTKST